MFCKSPYRIHVYVIICNTELSNYIMILLFQGSGNSTATLNELRLHACSASVVFGAEIMRAKLSVVLTHHITSSEAVPRKG